MPFLSAPFFYRAPTRSGSALSVDTAETTRPDMRPNGKHAHPTQTERPKQDPRYGPDEEIGEERGILKFFDPVKGFGFVMSTETGEDVFLPASVLKAKGLSTAAPGSLVIFEAEDTDAAPRIIEILSIDQSSATGPAPPPPVAAETTTGSTGVVESWKTDKGFGFIRAENGDNVFVHISVCGGTSPSPGDRMRIDYGRQTRGFVATSVGPA